MNFDKNNDSIDCSSSLCFANFNQDFSSLVVGRKSDYSIHSLAQVHKILPTLYKFDSKDVLIIERLFSSSLVAFVTSDLPSKLVLHHFKKKTEVCTYNYNTNILAIKINKARLVICLEDSLIIHSLNDLRTLHTIKDIPLHTHHTLSLSPHQSPSLLAYPSNNHNGGVVVFDAENLKAIWTIEAHDSVLSTMAFSQDGLLLATASTKGTVIRVFSIATKSKLYEFRRGMKRFATVYSLAFNKDSTFLACSSSTETVHIFRLDPTRQLSAVPSSPVTPVASTAASSGSGSYQEQGWMDLLGHAIRTSTSYLPSQVSEVLNQDRYFAVAKLPLCGSRNICGLTCINNNLYLMVVLSDGILMVYNVDCTQGGECILVAEHNLSSPSKQVTRTESNLSEDDHPEKPDDSKSREQSPQQPPQLQQQQQPPPPHQQQRKQRVSQAKKKDETSRDKQTNLESQPLPPLSQPPVPQSQPSEQQSHIPQQPPQPQSVVTSTDSTDFMKVTASTLSSLEPQWSELKKSYASVLGHNECCGGVGCDGEDRGECYDSGCGGREVEVVSSMNNDDVVGEDELKTCDADKSIELMEEEKKDPDVNDADGFVDGKESRSVVVKSHLEVNRDDDLKSEVKCHVKEDDKMAKKEYLQKKNEKGKNVRNSKNNRKKKVNRTGTGGHCPPSSSSSSSSSSYSLKTDTSGEKMGRDGDVGVGDVSVGDVGVDDVGGVGVGGNEKKVLTPEQEECTNRKKEQENTKVQNKNEKRTKQTPQQTKHPLKQQQQHKANKKQQQQKLSLKSDGELTLKDAVLSIEDLYLDAECGWLEDSVEFPAIFTKT